MKLKKQFCLLLMVFVTFLSVAQKDMISAGGQYPPQDSKPLLEGKLYVNGFSRTNTFKEISAVDLFKAFKQEKYKIAFSFKAGGLNEGYIILFNMKTTVKYNGKTISQTSRDGWPWLPGDMFVPAEGFDFIPALEELHTKSAFSSSYLPKGTYEIILEMTPSLKQPVSGRISSTSIKFNIE